MATGGVSATDAQIDQFNTTGAICEECGDQESAGTIITGQVDEISPSGEADLLTLEEDPSEAGTFSIAPSDVDRFVRGINNSLFFDKSSSLYWVSGAAIIKPFWSTGKAMAYGPTIEELETKILEGPEPSVDEIIQYQKTLENFGDPRAEIIKYGLAYYYPGKVEGVEDGVDDPKELDTPEGKEKFEQALDKLSENSREAREQIKEDLADRLGGHPTDFSLNSWGFVEDAFIHGDNIDKIIDFLNSREARVLQSLTLDNLLSGEKPKKVKEGLEKILTHSRIEKLYSFSVRDTVLDEESTKVLIENLPDTLFDLTLDHVYLGDQELAMIVDAIKARGLGTYQHQGEQGAYEHSFFQLTYNPITERGLEYLINKLTDPSHIEGASERRYISFSFVGNSHIDLTKLPDIIRGLKAKNPNQSPYQKITIDLAGLSIPSGLGRALRESSWGHVIEFKVSGYMG